MQSVTSGHDYPIINILTYFNTYIYVTGNSKQFYDLLPNMSVVMDYLSSLVGLLALLSLVLFSWLVVLGIIKVRTAPHPSRKVLHRNVLLLGQTSQVFVRDSDSHSRRQVLRAPPHQKKCVCAPGHAAVR